MFKRSEKIKDTSLASEFKLNPGRFRRPHRKSILSTRFGRLVDRTSYAGIFLLALLTLSASTAYFFFAASKENGITYSNGDPPKSLLDALYFSVVTFTSLGYGDISPHGPGKLVACCIALFGLILVALFVGKIASERQFSLLLLLHTSDSQRRLMSFCHDLDEMRRSIIAACVHPGGKGLSESVERMATRVDVITKYVAFHSHQAQLASFGNDSALRALYVHLQAAQCAFAHAFRSEFADEATGSRSLKQVMNIAEVITMLVRFQKNANRGWFRRPVPVDDSPPVRNVMACVSELKEWARTNESSWLILKVKERFLSLPWTGSHDGHVAEVATAMGITHALAQHCTDAWPHRLRGPGKIRHPRHQSRQKMMQEKVHRLRDDVCVRLAGVAKTIAAGAPLVFILKDVTRCIRDADEVLIAGGWRAEWRSVAPDDIHALLAGALDLQRAMIEVARSAVFDTREKRMAEAISDDVAKLVVQVFKLKYRVAASWCNCWPLREALRRLLPAAAETAAIAMQAQRYARKMSLNELFALSRTQQHRGCNPGRRLNALPDREAAATALTRDRRPTTGGRVRR